MNLDSNQIIVLGLLAPAITFVVRMIYEGATKLKVTLPSWALLLIVYVFAQVMALIWFPQALPSWPVLTGDPGTDLDLLAGFLTSLAVFVSATLGFGKMIYDYLLIKVKLPFRKLFKVK